jgi:hypothetical protein
MSVNDLRAPAPHGWSDGMTARYRALATCSAVLAAAALAAPGAIAQRQGSIAARATVLAAPADAAALRALHRLGPPWRAELFDVRVVPDDPMVPRETRRQRRPHRLVVIDYLRN